jgi:spermidine dehydrogenase
MKHRDRELGMDRAINRRDFMSGVGMALTGSLLYPWAEAQGIPSLRPAPGQQAGYYPPGQTGMRGYHPGAFDVAHELRDGRTWNELGPEADTGEHYDLVVVGSGISGMSAAYFFHRQAGPDARILVLDGLDYFGGHANRNEFHHNGRLLLANGGSVYIEDLAVYGEASQAMLRELGLEVERYSEFNDEDLYRSLKLRRGVFFDKETFGSDRLAVGERDLPWAEFLALTPLTEAVRKDIVRLYEEPVDYFPGLSLAEKKARLQKMTYQEFLLDVAKADPGVIPFFPHAGYWATGLDTFPAWIAKDHNYPGFQALGLPKKEEKSRQYFRFPDGNASITRLQARAMIPQVAPGSGMEDIVTAQFDYDKLDQEDAPVRIRLNSTAVRVRHLGDPQTSKQVEVTYVRGGKAQQVRASNCILACNNAIIPHMCPEFPDRQRQALSSSVKAVHISSLVLIRNWESFVKLGIRSARCPGSFHQGVGLGPPISIGKYRCPGSPDEPMVLHLGRTPLSPGLPAPEQFKAARWDLMRTTFETFERKIRDQLSRILADGGFDPARDIEAITVNRWPHGYAYGYDPIEGNLTYLPTGWPMTEWPEEKCNWKIGRKRFGRISVANTDAAAWAMAEGAMDEADRAVQEVLGEAS